MADDTSFRNLLRGASVLSNSSHSTTNSLNMQLSSTMIEDSEQLREIREHNTNPQKNSIISEINATEITIPVSGELATNTSNTTVDQQKRSAFAWWNLYGYGVRVDDYIYCTFDRNPSDNNNNNNSNSEDTDNRKTCVQRLAAKQSQSSSFVRHLQNVHNFTEVKHSRYLQFLEIQKELTPGWESMPNFTLNLFKSFTSERNQVAVHEFMQSQEAFDNNHHVLNFTRERFLDLLTTFIIANCLPASFTENNSSFRDVLGFCANMINAISKKVPVNSRLSSLVSAPSATTVLQLPSTQTVKTQLLTKFTKSKQMVQTLLRSQGSLSFTTDLWKSPTRENLARFFLEVTDDYGITPQIHCITADNAANNGALGKELEKLANMRNDFKFSRSENMLGCMNHIVNLACQELIVKGLKSIAPPDVSDLHAMMKEVNATENEAGLLNPIFRLRKGCLAIRISTALTENFEIFRERKKLPMLVLMTDSKTRWNSTKMMIDRFEVLEEAYTMTIDTASDQKVREECSLTAEHIHYIKRVNKLLACFEDVTNWLSAQRYTTINRSIVLFNGLFDDLDNFQNENTDDPVLVNAAEMCKIKLSKFYSRTDLTNVFACSTFLDSCLKFHYWSEDDGWTPSMIDDQKAKCEYAFYCFLKDYYTIEERKRTSASESDFSIYPPNTPSFSTSRDTIMEKESEQPSPILRVRGGISRKRRELHERQEPEGNQATQSIAKRRKSLLQTLLIDCSPWVKSNVTENKEFDLYLNSNDGDEYENPPDLVLFENKTDQADILNKNTQIGTMYATGPLTYWCRYAKKYPILSKFAAKCLGISSTSVASERLFSQAKGFIKTERARLEQEKADKYVLLNCWFREFNQSLSIS